MKCNNEDDVLEIVEKICTNLELATEFEEFAESNIKPFLDYDEDEGKGEHSHDMYKVYLEYLDHFEKRIESEINKHSSVDVPSFYRKAREILDLSSPKNSHRFFLQALLSTAEYQTFLYLMRNEAQRHRNSQLHISRRK
uniref:BART domain-containing protein n=1 Tax=Aureoumbra lagunensis TaxID=44058 RepID=A0A7S3K7D5_9STRA|mmetsp:Transcript_4244/g.5991  ORF Transcript_4244/g.5991 Transcript_4244/m.5991 type:complete len:139 (+) Transcript_4244:78-494(+)